MGVPCLGAWPPAPPAIQIVVHGLLGCLILAVAAGVVAYVIAWALATVIHRRARR